MKKLMLMGAFLLSVGAFAQTPVKPIDPNIPFGVDITNFEPDCPIGVGVLQRIHGEYDLVVTGPKSWIGKLTYAEIEEMVQDYICMYNKFPDYVEIRNFRPIKMLFNN